ncbi:unnamed protein product, partial [marine sediment metagenome]
LLKGDLKDPAFLKKVEELQIRLSKIDILTEPYSIVDAIKETNRYMNNNDKKFEIIPNDRAGIAQYLLFLSLAGGDFTESIITGDHEEMLVSCRVSTTRSGPVIKMVEQVKKDVAELFPEGTVEVKFSGLAVVFKDMREMLITNQIQSLILALIARIKNKKTYTGYISREEEFY